MSGAAPDGGRSERLARAAAPVAAFRDLLALAKPHITLLSVLTGAAGFWLAPGSLPRWEAFGLLLPSLALLIGGAHALNQYVERDLDALMERTRGRPLPDGRLRPRTALLLGLGASGLALLLLGLLINFLTALLGAVALVLYVLVYTPLKLVTPHAVLVGALPGAMPALMGWTAAAGDVGLPGLALFLVVCVWQIPHFLAIALFRREDYAQAGFRTVVAVHGEAIARRQTLLYTSWLLVASLLLAASGAAGPLALLAALAAGGAMWIAALRGPGRGTGREWARRFFRLLLLYLPALLLALAVELVLR